MEHTPSDADYARLLLFRTRLREFEQWSQERAAALGLTAAQHQLLLAIRGHEGARGPTIGQVAEYLLVRHHTAVGLVDRAEALDLVARRRDDDDHRVVRLAVTRKGAAKLRALSAAHLEELARMGPVLSALTQDRAAHP